MANLNRFKANKGLDNNSQTIINVADPVDAQDAATKNFTSNASNLTSGTVSVARGGTGLSSFTANGVVYASSANTITTGNTLTFDGTSLATTGFTATDGLLSNTTNWFNTKIVTGTVPQGFVLIGSATPYTTGQNSNTRFQIHGNVTYNARLSITQWTTGISPQATIFLGKSRSSTIGTQAAVQFGDIIGSLNFEASDGTRLVSTSAIRSDVDAAVSADTVPLSLQFYTGTTTASERMRIDSSGNVGIGTTSPATYGKLAVVGSIVSLTADTANIGTLSTAAGTTTLSAYNATGAALLLRTADSGGTVTERVRIDSTGRLLVTGGTTTGMTKQLNVYTAAEATVLLAADSTGEMGMAFRDQTAGLNWGGIQAFNNSGSNRYIVFSNGGEKMRLDASGNLLLGTTSASERLTVSGNTALPAATTEQRYIKVGNGRTGNGFSYIDLIGDATYTTFGLRIIRNDAGANSISDISHRGTGDFYINTVDAAPILLRTSGTTRLRIDSNGNVLNISSGGLGYGTGSGGAVTQATSRTTGVTLDKTNGAITLVSAAGTATWQSFTVTNSTVAATDTIIVSQKSGTDLYQIFVTNVAAGSFKITFATTGGTTTEQPVFNFAVIKAVTS